MIKLSYKLGLTKWALFYFCTFIIVHMTANEARADFVDWQNLKTALGQTATSSLDQTSGYLWAGSVLAVATANPKDDSFRAHNGNHQIMKKEISHYGDLLGTGIPGIALASAQYWGFDHLAGQRHFAALISAGVVTTTLKLAFGRQRPGGSADYKSFPSGHTSTTFASATVLAYEYGWTVGLPAYALAAFTGASRIADDAHWLSDVVGGAFIGVIFGRAAATETGAAATNTKAAAGPLWVPSYEQGRVALTFVSHF